MSEERFFNSVRESLMNYSPEAPQHLYQGMRRRLWWSNFVKLDMSRLNIWYVLLGLAVATGSVFNTMDSKEKAASTLIEVAPHSTAAVENAQSLSVNMPQNSTENTVGHQAELAPVCSGTNHSSCGGGSGISARTDPGVASSIKPGSANIEPGAPITSEPLTMEPVKDLGTAPSVELSPAVESAQTQIPSEQVASKPPRKAKEWVIPVIKDIKD